MKPHEEWLFKAGNDLASAEILMNASKPLYDIAIYHTQQCAEKALKSYLAFKEQEIDKIHNLITLTNLCSQFDAEFASLRDDALYLNPYSTLYRYPEGDLMPPKEEVKKAMDTASKIFEFVKIKFTS